MKRTYPTRRHRDALTSEDLLGLLPPSLRREVVGEAQRLGATLETLDLAMPSQLEQLREFNPNHDAKGEFASGGGGGGAPRWSRMDRGDDYGYETDGARIYDQGGGLGTSRGSGRWYVEVDGIGHVGSLDTLPEAKAAAAEALRSRTKEAALREFNQNHDEKGRFTFGDGGSGKAGPMRMEDMQSRWANLDRGLLRYVGDPTNPGATAIINEQKGLVDAMHAASPVGTPGGTRADVVVVGTGPAGLSSAIYGGSEGLNTVVLEGGGRPGGQAAYSSRIENVLGFPAGVTGAQYAAMGADQAERLGADIRYNTQVTGMAYDPTTGVKTLTLGDGSQIQTNSVVIAGGVQARELGVPGENSPDVVHLDSTALKGITADGSPSLIVGGQNSAGQAAVDVASDGRPVTILTRSGQLGAGMSDYLVQQINEAPNIHVAAGSVASFNTGSDGGLTSATLQDGTTIPAGGAGVFIGQVPETQWAGVATGADGKILVGQNGAGPLETSIPGVFAAGDVREGSIGRVAVASGEGAMAISYVHNYLGSMKH